MTAPQSCCHNPGFALPEPPTDQVILLRWHRAPPAHRGTLTHSPNFSLNHAERTPSILRGGSTRGGSQPPTQPQTQARGLGGCSVFRQRTGEVTQPRSATAAFCWDPFQVGEGSSGDLRVLRGVGGRVPLRAAELQVPCVW